MTVTDLELKGLKLIELKLFRDERGFFTERFNEMRFLEAGLPIQFVQDNHSLSLPGVIRGMHYQVHPKQGKLVGVIRGKIWDVSLDLRKGSPTFGRHVATELSGENGRLLWIPPGFAHGFSVLGEEPADVLYKVDAPYSPMGDRGIRWNDPELGIQWPLGGRKPVISAKDEALPSFAEYRAHPLF